MENKYINSLLALKAEDILNVSLDRPEALFSNIKTLDELKYSYRKLISVWHPDKNIGRKSTDLIFAHIDLLYIKAKQKIIQNTWNLGQVVFLDEPFAYEKSFDFDLGMCYIGKEKVAWLINSEFEDLALNAIKTIESLKFADNNMKEQMKTFLPCIIRYKKLSNNKLLLLLKKDKNSILLKDISKFYNNKIDPKHVAWILGNCYNFSCFLTYNNLMYGAIDSNHLFVNPENHTVEFLGGWWFSCREGEKLKAINRLALDVAPLEIINDKKATYKLDLELIRLLGRTLLGDKNGIHLLKDKEIPVSLVIWLRNTAGKNNSFQEYEKWNDVLKQSFGVRRFIKMNLKTSDIY